LWEEVSLGQGPLNLVTTIEELLGSQNCGSGLKIRDYGRRDPSRWSCGALYPLKLALTTATSDGRSVAVVCSRTKATELLLLFNSYGSDLDR
jgi:hypothetical protein